MSNSGRKAVARPDAMVEAGFFYFVYCGGKGGGGCIEPMGVDGVVLEFKVPKFIVYNERIVFENRMFYGFRAYTDGGPTGFCDHSLGVEVPWYMALSVDGNLTPTEIVAQGVELIGEAPYEIEFKANKIPQPINPAWNSRIYMHVYWGNEGYMNGEAINAQPPRGDSFKIVKHDYEIKT